MESFIPSTTRTEINFNLTETYSTGYIHTSTETFFHLC